MLVTVPFKEARVASFKKLSGDNNQEIPTRRTRHAPSYDRWRRDDLYHLAKQKGIEERANMSNEELVHALSRSQSDAP
jgi:hypothetical protein